MYWLVEVVTQLGKCLDLGDWIGVSGFLFITKTGELSLHVRIPRDVVEAAVEAALVD